MVNDIVPAAKAVYGKPGDFVDNTVRESAKRTAMKIATKPSFRDAWKWHHRCLVVTARP
jgi:hypothetical protein